MRQAKYGLMVMLLVVMQFSEATAQIRIESSIGDITPDGGFPRIQGWLRAARKSLHKKLEGTTWRAVKRGQTIVFGKQKSFIMSKHGSGAGVWLVTGANELLSEVVF